MLQHSWRKFTGGSVKFRKPAISLSARPLCTTSGLRHDSTSPPRCDRSTSATHVQG
ncbi:MAG: hypothetical protein IJ844_05495 [Prevotella sp.]|nr:hypothetical protein [Prevotella sp.]